MTNREAIKIIEWIKNTHPERITCEALTLAIAALERQGQGRWKKIGVWGRVYRCNQCGNFLDFDAVNAGRGDANFCPNCGAKMDGERKENCNEVD